MNILLLAHDLSDAAIAKRTEMLQKGAAIIELAGFRRSGLPIKQIAGCQPIDLGQTGNGSFFHRIAMVLFTIFRPKLLQTRFLKADVVIARNLEMLAIAVCGIRSLKKKPILIYEILDIHRLLLGSNLIGNILRWVERTLLISAQAIFTSSPAFISNYFQKINPTHLPIKLIENKILKSSRLPLPAHNSMIANTPWVIGWFGIIRCRKSFNILIHLAKKYADKVIIVIHGRPALDQIPDFHQIVEETPGVKFGGSYKNPEDLAEIYNNVHFNWVIDMYEQGLNSSWLLPNRIYEGGYFGVVPIAIENVETGQYLKNLAIGVLLPDAFSILDDDFFLKLSSEEYAQLAMKVQNIPSSQWIYDESDCIDLIKYIKDLKLSENIVHD